LDAGNKSLEAYERVKTPHDMRFQADLLLVRSRISLAAGNPAGVAQDAEAALAIRQRTDVPTSPEIARAQAALAAAKQAAAK